MAMTLRLSDADDKLLTERAARTGRSKHDLATDAIHSYLTSDVNYIEELEDQAAIAAYDLAKAKGEVTFVSQDEAKRQLGIAS